MLAEYAGVLYLVGVDLKTGVAAVASGALYSTVQGAPYGIYSDFIRKRFNWKE